MWENTIYCHDIQHGINKHDSNERGFLHQSELVRHTSQPVACGIKNIHSWVYHTCITKQLSKRRISQAKYVYYISLVYGYVLMSDEIEGNWILFCISHIMQSYWSARLHYLSCTIYCMRKVLICLVLFWYQDISLKTCDLLTFLIQDFFIGNDDIVWQLSASKVIFKYITNIVQYLTTTKATYPEPSL